MDSHSTESSAPSSPTDLTIQEGECVISFSDCQELARSVKLASESLVEGSWVDISDIRGSKPRFIPDNFESAKAFLRASVAGILSTPSTNFSTPVTSRSKESSDMGVCHQCHGPIGAGAHQGSAFGKGVCSHQHSHFCRGSIVENLSWAPCPPGYIYNPDLDLASGPGFESTLDTFNFQAGAGNQQNGPSSSTPVVGDDGQAGLLQPHQLGPIRAGGGQPPLGHSTADRFPGVDNCDRRQLDREYPHTDNRFPSRVNMDQGAVGGGSPANNGHHISENIQNNIESHRAANQNDRLVTNRPTGDVDITDLRTNPDLRVRVENLVEGFIRPNIPSLSAAPSSYQSSGDGIRVTGDVIRGTGDDTGQAGLGAIPKTFTLQSGTAATNASTNQPEQQVNTAQHVSPYTPAQQGVQPGQSNLQQYLPGQYLGQPAYQPVTPNPPLQQTRPHAPQQTMQHAPLPQQQGSLRQQPVQQRLAPQQLAQQGCPQLQGFPQQQVLAPQQQVHQGLYPQQASLQGFSQQPQPGLAQQPTQQGSQQQHGQQSFYQQLQNNHQGSVQHQVLQPPQKYSYTPVQNNQPFTSNPIQSNSVAAAQGQALPHAGQQFGQSPRQQQAALGQDQAQHCYEWITDSVGRKILVRTPFPPTHQAAFSSHPGQQQPVPQLIATPPQQYRTEFRCSPSTGRQWTVQVPVCSQSVPGPPAVAPPTYEWRIDRHTGEKFQVPVAGQNGGQTPQFANNTPSGQHQFTSHVSRLDSSRLQSETIVNDQTSNSTLTSHERVAGIVSLLEGGGGTKKGPKVIEFSKKCPTKYSKQATLSNINLPLYAWGVIEEIEAALSGRSQSMPSATVLGKLRHLKNTLEVCCQNSSSHDFTAYGWTLAKDYSTKLNDEIDQGRTTWQDIPLEVKTSTLMSATMENPRPLPKVEPRRQGTGMVKGTGMGTGTGEKKELCTTYNKCQQENKCDYEVANPTRSCLRKHECSWCRTNKNQCWRHQEWKCRNKGAGGSG